MNALECFLFLLYIPVGDSVAGILIIPGQARNWSESLALSQTTLVPLILDPGFFPAGMDPVTVAPIVPKMRKLTQSAIIVIAVSVVSFLVAVFVVGKFPGDENPFPHRGLQRTQIHILWACLLPEWPSPL